MKKKKGEKRKNRRAKKETLAADTEKSWALYCFDCVLKKNST